MRGVPVRRQAGGPGQEALDQLALAAGIGLGEDPFQGLACGFDAALGFLGEFR